MDKIEETILKDFRELFNKEIRFLEDAGFDGAALGTRRIMESALIKLEHYITILSEKNKRQ